MKKPLSSDHEYDANQDAKARRAAFEAVLRWAVISEAKASVALDELVPT